MSTNDGGPAFGQVVELRCVRVEPTGKTEWQPALAQGGMSLRDYFAAHALAGIEAAQGSDGHYMADPQKVAQRAYRLAEAMLSARGEA